MTPEHKALAESHEAMVNILAQMLSRSELIGACPVYGMPDRETFHRAADILTLARRLRKPLEEA